MLACVGPLHFGIQYLGLKLADDLSPMVVAMQLWAPASVVFAALLLKEAVTPLRWAGVGLAFLGAASMVQRYEVSRTTPYLLTTPVITFVLAAAVLGDRITPQILIGAATTMGGVALVALAERRFKAVV